MSATHKTELVNFTEHQDDGTQRAGRADRCECERLVAPAVEGDAQVDEGEKADEHGDEDEAQPQGEIEGEKLDELTGEGNEAPELRCPNVPIMHDATT